MHYATCICIPAIKQTTYVVKGGDVCNRSLVSLLNGVFSQQLDSLQVYVRRATSPRSTCFRSCVVARAAVSGRPVCMWWMRRKRPWTMRRGSHDYRRWNTCRNGSGHRVPYVTTVASGRHLMKRAAHKPTLDVNHVALTWKIIIRSGHMLHKSLSWPVLVCVVIGWL